MVLPSQRANPACQVHSRFPAQVLPVSGKGSLGETAHPARIGCCQRSLHAPLPHRHSAWVTLFNVVPSLPCTGTLEMA